MQKRNRVSDLRRSDYFSEWITAHHQESKGLMYKNERDVNPKT